MQGFFYTLLLKYFQRGGTRMKWDERLNMAIDCIEEYLENEIDMNVIAGIMCQSKDSLQRTFSLILDMPISEYIRKRRMTLAAVELRNSDVKVIDLALRLGYESPESFTRSFKEIFGVTPSAARNKNIQLTLFPRVTCLLTLKGEIKMERKFAGINGQAINWKGFDWAAWQNPQDVTKVFDNCITAAKKWKDAGYKTVLDLGAGMGHNSIYFAKQGFAVSAIEISDFAVDYLKKWAERENLEINATVGDMHSLPYSDNSFDCLFEYHTIRHSGTAGIKMIISEIERVVKPGGEVYITFLSKDSNDFTEKWYPQIDENSLICQTLAEMGVPHYYADLSDINGLLANFDVESILHRGYYSNDSKVKQKHYYVTGRKKIR